VDRTRCHRNRRAILLVVPGKEREPFIGSEALALGIMNRHQLRTQNRLLFPNVYLAKRVPVSLDRRIAAAWLWTNREGVIAGSAAAALLGTKWIAEDIAIEVIHPNNHPPRGVLTRRDILLDGEVTAVAELMVTTPERTAFDIGRRQPCRTGVSELDALLRATALTLDQVASIARRHPRVRGLRNLEAVLGLVDPGAQSPRETYLRLLLVENGLPRPQTQIPVVTEGGTYYLDMGWPEYMVAVEYDGEHHRSDLRQYRKDIRRMEELWRVGWVVIRVVAGDRPAEILRRVRCALDARQSSVY
jgi:very-short-patch-repair endonuclease